MRYIILFLMTSFFNISLNAQVNFNIEKSLEEINNSTFNGLLLNDPLVAKFLTDLAYLYRIDFDEKLRGLYWVLIEPESNIPKELTEFNLGEIDKERKLIVLSRACLLDRDILKATLFRELSHYFGLPYNENCCEIMRVNKPKGYSYAWVDDSEVSEVEFDKLFTAMMKL
jgi:hypothetical protein